MKRIGGYDIGNHNVTLRPPRPARDGLIESDVTVRLADDPILDATEVQVHACQGQVTLTGNIVNHVDWERAEDIARSVAGVQYVMNNLRVKQHGTSGATG